MTLFFMPFGVECTSLCIMFSGKSVIIVAMNHMWVKNVTWIQIMTQTGMVNKINPFEIIWDCIGEFLVKNSSNQLPKFQEKNTDNSSTSTFKRTKNEIVNFLPSCKRRDISSQSLTSFINRNTQLFFHKKCFKFQTV